MKKSTIFLIVLVAIFFTSTLVLIKLNYLKPQPTTISTTSIIPTVSVDPLSDWKTYENKEYGFEFKYPSNYQIKIIGDGINLQKNNTRALLYISKFDNPNSLEINQWFENQPKQDIQAIKDTHTMTKIVVGGHVGLKFIKKQSEIGYKDFIIIIGNGTSVYYLNFGPLEDEVNISNQILSTFKFTNTISDPTLGWKNFGSMSYDISFKYPQDWSVETENMTIFLKSPKTITALSNKNNTWTRVGDLIISSLTQKTLPNNQNNLPLSSWITSNYNANPIHSITLAGMNGFKVTSCGDSCLEEIYLEDENVIYKIDSGNSDHFTAELNQILSTLKSSHSPSLIQSNQQSTVAGICQELSKNQEVTITISPDNVPVPRCAQMTSGQKLKITNNSPNSIEIYQTNPKTIIKPGESFVFPQAVGAFLEQGIHSIAGAEIWLQ